MGVIILEPGHKLTKDEFLIALKDYQSYIKITADIEQNIVGIGGMYQYDSEQILIKNYNSMQRNIWGGGYYPFTKKFRTDALVNMRPISENLSHEITDPKRREAFLNIAKNIANQIESLI